jgi:hypothetical protein
MEKKQRKKREKKKMSIITDDLISPYYIAKDEFNFGLYEKTSGIDKLVGYYSDFGRVLHKLVDMKTNYKENYSSLKEYMDEYEQHKKEIAKLISL